MAQVDYTRITSNIAALNSLNSLRSINTKLGTAQMRLSTGKRINQASDDPAGLTIGLKLNARNEGLKVAVSNIGDAKNMLAVAESGLQQINTILTEMKSKATAAASDTLGSEERGAIQDQLKSLARQINDIVGETQWNGSSLLDGTVSKSLQTGAGSRDATIWSLDQNHKASSLGVATDSTTGASVTISGNVNGSFATSHTAGIEMAAAFNGLSPLADGTYKFKVADKATGATTSKTTSLNSVSGMASLLGQTGATSELKSGYYTLTIDKVASGKSTIDYTVTDKFGNVVATYDGLNTSATTDLLDARGQSIGVQLKTNSNINVGDKINFEYIAAGEVKMQLYQVRGSSEELVAVDANGIDDSGTDNRATNGVDHREAYFYMDAGNSYDTGVGFKIHLKSFATVATNESSQFDFTNATTDVDVDVSTASLAQTFMDSVDSAITKVTNSLNSIGSLVSRLGAKEEAVGTAQINTEAAYSRIMNADMALEQVDAAKYQILQQTAVAMLAQANAGPQGILSLFR